MTDLPALKSLERRLSEAKRGSYELDCEIDDLRASLMLGWTIEKARDTRIITRPSPDLVEHYSRSVDAAIALAEAVLKPKGMNRHGYDQIGDEAFEAYVSRNNVDSGHWYFEATAPTIALALTLAVVRALIAQEEGK
jgi:hypothetical protein